MSDRTTSRLLTIAAFLLLAIAATVLPLVSAQDAAYPWTQSQTVQPADLLKELSAAKNAPTVVFVGYPRLFTSGHIKGAQYHGSGNTAEGIAQLKAWAGALPRSANLVIYCGCCPMDHCPNDRPAFAALHEMGFTKLRVLILSSSFAQDWADKGYPYDRGQ